MQSCNAGGTYSGVVYASSTCSGTSSTFTGESGRCGSTGAGEGTKVTCNHAMRAGVALWTIAALALVALKAMA